MKFNKAKIKSKMNDLENVNPDDLGIYRKVTTSARQCFLLGKSVAGLDEILKKHPLNHSESLKIISFSGGFASISFIKSVAERETIEYLFASTLRVGEKQVGVLDDLEFSGKLKHAEFIVGGLMKNDEKTDYDYYGAFTRACKKNGWRYVVTNNHSKIILMQTPKNHYVLETSSNLNENPKIEQFSFENNKELFDFYKKFFEKVMEVAEHDSG